MHTWHEKSYQEYVAMWLDGLEDGMRGKTSISSHIVRYLRNKNGNKCVGCGWDRVHPTTQEVPLEVHHIDGNFKNNNEENLLLLCPNCHALTETYRGRNRGNGRERK